MNDLATDNPNTAIADNPQMEPASPVSGTSAPGGQASEAAPAGELFKGVDPNRLPPEAKAHYDSMLRDYREKTAKLSESTKSEVEKAVQAYREKATFYDQIANQPDFVERWNSYVQESQAKSTVDENGDPVTQVKAELSQLRQEIQREKQMTEINQVTEAFAEAVSDKGEKLHPEFDQLNTLSIGQLQEGDKAQEFSLLRAGIELAQGNSPQEKLANGYKAAKAVYDSIFEAGKKAGMGRLQTKLLNGTNPPSNSGGEVLSVTEKRPKSAREAFEMAKRNQVVSRD